MFRMKNPFKLIAAQVDAKVHLPLPRFQANRYKAATSSTVRDLKFAKIIGPNLENGTLFAIGSVSLNFASLNIFSKRFKNTRFSKANISSKTLKAKFTS